VLQDECFLGRTALWSVIFEPESELIAIHARTFWGCVSLGVLFIPRSVRRLERDWASNSSLITVIFESAASLRDMIMVGSADLNGDFEIEILLNDLRLDFPGFVVDSRPDGLIRLLRRDVPIDDIQW
jgi:hypothetical protein